MRAFSNDTAVRCVMMEWQHSLSVYSLRFWFSACMVGSTDYQLVSGIN